jgi:hypothetical protein
MKKHLIWAALLCGLVLVLGLFLGGCENPSSGGGDDDKGDGGGTTAIGPVSGLAGAPADGSVTLTWTDPGDGDLDHIEITWSPNGFDPVSIDAGVESKTIDGLTNNTWYTFELVAVDTSGNYSESKTIAKIAGNPSDLGVLSYPGKTQILVRWTDPAYPGFDHIEITWQPGNGSMIVPPGKGFATVSSLGTGEYTITVDTVNTSNEKSGGQSITASTDPAAWNWLPSQSPASHTSSDAVGALAYSAYNGGRFLMTWYAGTTSMGIHYSLDGDTWTAAGDSQFGTYTVSSIASNPDGSVLVAVGNGGKISWSTDGGETWTAVTGADNPFTTADSLRGAAYLNGQFAAFGNNGKMAWSADGGQSWTLVADTKFGNNHIVSMAYGNGTYLAGGATNGTVRLVKSTDGVTWTDITSSVIGLSSRSANGIAHNGNNTFAAISSAGCVAYSTDAGVNWTLVAGPGGIATSTILNCIIWDGERFIVGGANGKVIWSSDGITWNLPTNNMRGAFPGSATGVANITGIAFGKGRYVIAGAYGAIAYCIK